jgi:transcriptional regulator with XRE-family HTH domain
MNIETYYPSAEALNLRIDMKATGKNLAAIFAERGQSLSSTSNLIAVSPQAVHHWTIGKSLPKLENLIYLAEILKFNVQDVIVVEHNDNVNTQMELFNS